MALIVVEFLCTTHGRAALTFRRDAVPDEFPCPACGELAPYVISAPLGRVKQGEVTRGKNDEKPHPLALDTQALADGQPLSEFRAQRKKLHRDARWKANKEALK